MRILIYGSTYLTTVCCRRLEAETNHILVGYIPNEHTPTVPGRMDLPLAGPGIRHDIALSLQYDARILGEPNAFNLHTGLLPDWGGCDILYHTLKLAAKAGGVWEQGLTFHKITDKWDFGPVVARTSYPVLPGDSIFDLYKRMAAVAPGFVVSALSLVELIGPERVDECWSQAPTLYSRGDVDRGDADIYAGTLIELRRRFVLAP